MSKVQSKEEAKAELKRWLANAKKDAAGQRYTKHDVNIIRSLLAEWKKKNYPAGYYWEDFEAAFFKASVLTKDDIVHKQTLKSGETKDERATKSLQSKAGAIRVEDNKWLKHHDESLVIAKLPPKKMGGKSSTFELPSFLNAYGLSQKDWDKIQTKRAKDEADKAQAALKAAS